MLKRIRNWLAPVFAVAAVGFALVDVASAYTQPPPFNPCVATRGEWCWTICVWDTDHPWWCLWCEDGWDCDSASIPIIECDATCVN